MDANLEMLLNFGLVFFTEEERILTTLNVMRELNKCCCLVLISVICNINSFRLSLFFIALSNCCNSGTVFIKTCAVSWEF